MTNEPCALLLDSWAVIYLLPPLLPGEHSLRDATAGGGRARNRAIQDICAMGRHPASFSRSRIHSKNFRRDLGLTGTLSCPTGPVRIFSLDQPESVMALIVEYPRLQVDEPRIGTRQA